jgi:branched-chain amino acid transport system ATP-binding protein
MPLLRIDDINLSFGGVKAINGVSINVERGSIHAIIGPNGAGKTSIFNCISSVYKPQRGAVYFEDRKVTGMKPDHVTHLGIARTFQNIALFHHMTVLDNLMLGRHQFMKRGILTGGIFLGPARTEEIENRKAVEDIIDFLEIENIRKKPVGTLAYGLRKRVELGRALALKPKLLLLDEPMAGAGAEETPRLVATLKGLKRRTTIVLVEHDMQAVFALADRISVLVEGRIIATDTPNAVRANPAVRAAYLGEAA